MLTVVAGLSRAVRGWSAPACVLMKGGGAAKEREAVVTTARRSGMVSCILDLWMLGVGVFECAGGFKVDSLLF